MKTWALAGVLLSPSSQIDLPSVNLSIPGKVERESECGPFEINQAGAASALPFQETN